MARQIEPFYDGAMFIPFFLELKAAKVPVSLREYLTLLEGLEAGLVDYDVEGFYYLARAALVKDERHIDRFDQVFAHVFRGVEAVSSEAGIDLSKARRVDARLYAGAGEEPLGQGRSALPG